jgi:hypothetical protein
MPQRTATTCTLLWMRAFSRRASRAALTSPSLSEENVLLSSCATCTLASSRSPQSPWMVSEFCLSRATHGIPCLEQAFQVTRHPSCTLDQRKFRIHGNTVQCQATVIQVKLAAGSIILMFYTCLLSVIMSSCIHHDIIHVHVHS